MSTTDKNKDGMDELNKIIETYTDGNYLFSKTAKEEMAKDILALFNVVGRSEQLLAVAEYVYNNFDDSSSKTAKDYLQDFLSQ